MSPVSKATVHVMPLHDQYFISPFFNALWADSAVEQKKWMALHQHLHAGWQHA